MADQNRSDLEINGLVVRLLLHYPREYLSPHVNEELGKDWLDDLREFGPDIVRVACTEWRQVHPRRPTPADIRLLCIAEHRRLHPEPEVPYLPAPRPRARTPEEIAYAEERATRMRAIIKGLVP